MEPLKKLTNTRGKTSNIPSSTENTGIPKSSTSRQAARFFPFCEKYDGFSVRKTSTISESIQAILADQEKEEETVVKVPLRTKVKIKEAKEESLEETNIC